MSEKATPTTTKENLPAKGNGPSVEHMNTVLKAMGLRLNIDNE